MSKKAKERARAEREEQPVPAVVEQIVGRTGVTGEVTKSGSGSSRGGMLGE